MIVLYQDISAAIQYFVVRQPCSDEVSDWIRLKDYPEARHLLQLDAEREETTQSRTAQVFLDNLERLNNLGEAYCATFLADLRHRLGEHYTPEWLVTKMVRRVAGSGTIADPACGDGRFLTSLIELGHPLERLWGVELNPLVVMMARYNVWVAAGRPTHIPCKIEWSDFLLGAHYNGMGKIEDLPAPDMFIGNTP